MSDSYISQQLNFTQDIATISFAYKLGCSSGWSGGNCSQAVNDTDCVRSSSNTNCVKLLFDFCLL